VSARLGLRPRHVHLRFRAQDGRAIAGVYTSGRVIAHEVRGDEVRIEVELPERLLARYEGNLAK
jgi:hypothetical protein